MILYHGSDHIIKAPIFHGGKRSNDYGYGFYTTETLELAKEWACAKGTDGYANRYEIELDNLRILRLNSPNCNILNWLAILAKHRTYWQRNSISEEAKRYLQDNFFIDPDEYDVVIGYRADDSYFSFAQDFISNAISLKKLSQAMRLGKLGEQVVLKSARSFARLRFLEALPAPAAIYYSRKANRDRAARRSYRTLAAEKDAAQDIYMLDIMREGIKNGDPRL